MMIHWLCSFRAKVAQRIQIRCETILSMQFLKQNNWILVSFMNIGFFLRVQLHILQNSFIYCTKELWHVFFAFRHAVLKGELILSEHAKLKEEELMNVLRHKIRVEEPFPENFTSLFYFWKVREELNQSWGLKRHTYCGFAAVDEGNWVDM